MTARAQADGTCCCPCCTAARRRFTADPLQLALFVDAGPLIPAARQRRGGGGRMPSLKELRDD